MLPEAKHKIKYGKGLKILALKIQFKDYQQYLHK